MTINERTTLLPKEYQKTYSITIPQDDLNNNVSNSSDNGVLCEYDSYALTKDELNKYIDDPWWIKMRYGCFATCWIVCLIALGISLYIAADALQHDTCGTPLTNNGTVSPAVLSLPGSSIVSSSPSPLADVPAGSTPPSSIVLTLLGQPAS
uniref:Solute carrier family 3 member 2 N-terminal domain-containing protein n=1 Tax=Anopheles epiroticus TaxID=199890 RepID=A0A182P819_9DIPT